MAGITSVSFLTHERSQDAHQVCLDVGACQKIIDGKIKIKNDSPIERLTKTGIRFQNGSEIEADVIMCATGYAEGSVSVLLLEV